MAATCLRRTKNVVREELGLTQRTIRECPVQLNPGDREIYDFFKTNASHLVAGMLSNKAGGNILPIINTLRLICNHGQRLLPQFALEAWKKRCNSRTTPGLETLESSRSCFSCGTDVSSNEALSDFACSHRLCANCAESDDGQSTLLDSLVCPLCAQESSRAVEEVMPNYQPSAKVKALLENLRLEQGDFTFSPNEKPTKR